MSGKTSYLSTEMLKVLRGDSPATYTQTYATLFTTAPTSDSPGGVAASVEWSPTTARIMVSSDGATQPYWLPTETTTDGAQVRNVGKIEWPTIAGLSGSVTIVAVGIYTDSSGGSLLYWRDLVEPRLVNNGDTILFMHNTFKVTEQ